MLGQKILLNGMTEMAMAEEIILKVQQQMFVQMMQELQLGLLKGEIDGAVSIPMVMDGLIWDTDGDGYGDSITGNQGDSCPKLRGTSILDRLGCRDTDGDGWSDPTDTWQAHPFGLADSFPNEALQWRDSDGDGFGDVALGSMRDDCPLSAGDSIRDLQGCPDANNDGWSDDYGGLKSAIAILGEDPAASWLTYLVIGLGFISGALLALLVKKSRDDDDLTGDEIFETKQHVDFEQLTENTFPVDGMIPLEQLPPLPELSLPMPTIDNQPIVASETVEGGEYNA
jgi:hypothetical protein